MFKTEITENNIQTISNINNYHGAIPAGYDLVEYRKFTDPMEGFVLNGFDEIGMCVEPQWASHAFVKVGDFYRAESK